MSQEESKPSSSLESVRSADSPLIGRYRRVATLGRGGMADVFEAVDDVSGRRVALKLLRGAELADKREFRHALFEREYHALSQLSHPRVVQAYEYGISGEGPFYTMELLDGADLMELSPMPWQKACAVMRDVCAVLSLLHSRRMLYRDLNPRNIRCTSDGFGRLIDFGALMPMGSPRKVVGMPAFVAPELVNRQLADGRADLFGVGTSLYHALTGKLAFPARTFNELPWQWQSTPRRPSELVEGIPEALDALVLDLLQIDVALRPGSAGDVIDRLEAIASLPRDKRVFVARAYLSTPTLVERDPLLSRIGKRLDNARAGRGRATVVQGAPGTGRSRLVDACVLQAKLAGMLTAVADAGDGQVGPYGAVRVLAGQLLEAAPDLAREAAAPHAAVLGHVVPELARPDTPLTRFDDPRALRPATQAALRNWLTTIAEARPLVLAIDDVDLVDEPSAALVARLSADANRHPIAIVCSALAQPGGNPVAMALLASTAAYATLEPLTDAGTRQLLASVFGEGPRLQLVAARVHAVSEGNPRDVMQLAQHLVDTRKVHLDGGAWALPAQLDKDDLPTSASAAMARRASGLGERALALARMLALHDQGALALEDFVELFETHSASSVVKALGELVEGEVVRLVGGHYALSRPAWKQVLLEGLTDQARAPMHAQLARLLERHGDGLRTVQHLRWSGQPDRALDRLISFSADSQKATAADPEGFSRLVEGLPSGWYELFDWAVETSRAQGRPPVGRYELQGRLLGILAVADPTLGSEHALELLSTLHDAVGLDLYEDLPDEVQGMDRLKAALDGAQARFDATPPEQQVIPPLAAIQPLAQGVIPTAALAVTGYDYDLLFEVPSLKPLHPLSPALQVVTLLMDGMTDRMTGRLERSIASYERAVEMLDQAGHSGVTESHATHMRMGIIWGMGMTFAWLGSQRANDCVDPLLADPWHSVSGLLVKMLHAYWQAQPERGDALKELWVLQRIEARSQQWFDGAHLVAEVTAHATADDLPRLRSALKDIEALATHAPGWAPVHDYARGEYHRIRGDAEQALGAFEAACQARDAAQHIIWAFAAAGQVRTLIALGRTEEAAERAQTFVKLGHEAGLRHLVRHVRIPLGLALAERGDKEAGAAELDAVLAELSQASSTGLLAAWANETRAQIALHDEDVDTANACLARVRAHLRAGENALGRRRAQLLHDRIHGRRSAAEAEAHGRQQALLEAELRSAITHCQTDSARAQAALELFTAKVGALGGVLRLVDDGDGAGTGERAVVGVEADAEHLNALADALYSEVTGNGDSMITHTGESDEVVDMHIRSVILKHESGGSQVITGVAVLALVPGTDLSIDPDALASAMSRTLVAHSRDSHRPDAESC